MTIPVDPTFIEPLQDAIVKSSSNFLFSSAESSLPLSAPVLRMSVPEGTVIPGSSIVALDKAYLFHLLARDPRKVVAPGKSLLSVLSGLNQTPTRPLESVPEKSVAFWDQTLKTLSSPLPSSQISRLKPMYKDLHEALAPLFPSKHPVLITFSLPLPPTTSPLISAIIHVRDTLSALRQRCAPVRDVIIDENLHRIRHRSPSASTEDLAELLVNVIRSALQLSIDMRNDYSNAVLATASEKELADMVAIMAETQEQRMVLQFWESKEAMRKAWARWMGGFRPADPGLQVQPKQLWILKLIESLGKPHAITSKLIRPPQSHKSTTGSDRNYSNVDSKPVLEPQNMHPPQFLFSGPTLLHLQNCIQALTIAASLQSLVSTPRTAPPPLRPEVDDSTTPANWTFTERIWALLEPEIGKTDGESSETKIVNLADEVVMTHNSALPPGVTTLDPHLERRLRTTVDRILRTDDPVFTLLQKRLLAALSAAMLNTPIAEEPSPIRMQSGRPQHQRGISPSPLPVPQSARKGIKIVAKGFEDPVIAKQCSIAAFSLRRSLEWVERVWGDTMPY